MESPPVEDLLAEVRQWPHKGAVALPNAERGLIQSLKEAEAVRQSLEQDQAGDDEQPV